MCVNPCQCVPGPVCECEGCQGDEVGCQEGHVEAAVQEQPLWQTTPVHGPLVEELPAKVERSTYIADRRVEEKRSTQKNLMKTI